MIREALILLLKLEKRLLPLRYANVSCLYPGPIYQPRHVRKRNDLTLLPAASHPDWIVSDMERCFSLRAKIGSPLLSPHVPGSDPVWGPVRMPDDCTKLPPGGWMQQSLGERTYAQRQHLIRSHIY